MLAAAALTASSCIKSMPKNDECDILSAWVEGEGIDVNFYNRSQMKKENIRLVDLDDLHQSHPYPFLKKMLRLSLRTL